jgi:hypothetical protein
MDSLRKIYHKVVTIPLENVETLWSELEAFENGLNRITVRLNPCYPLTVFSAESVFLLTHWR